LVPIEVHYMEKNPGMFSSKTLISFRLKKEWHGSWISWMTLGWVNYQQKWTTLFNRHMHVAAIVQ